MFSRDPFFKQPKIERQLILLEDYSFECQCEACTNNYPLFHSLKSIDKKLLKLVKKEKNEILKSNPSMAMKKFPQICDHLQNLHEKSTPSSEKVLFQECLQQCLATITKPKILF